MREGHSNQKGFTLLELLIVISIATLVVGAVAAVFFQLSSGSDRNSNYMTAYTQVQNAGSWISHDAVMAQDVDVNSGLVTLEWASWEGDAHQVVYTLEDADGGLKNLMRSYSDNSGTETTFVATYIDLSNTSCSWDGEVLTLVVTAQVGQQTAARTYKIEPRALS